MEIKKNNFSLAREIARLGWGLILLCLSLVALSILVPTLLWSIKLMLGG